ncbi:MAG: IMP dehydrogenase [Thermotoga sp.]|nr:MAG: IMP dehydrogenase [Thermotoga sp.]
MDKALTFDDVLLIPNYSNILPNQVDVKTRITRNINVNLPFISAAMDTVTEADMAKAMAREGGIGFIHKNMSIERQAMEVDRVKRTENGIISNPVTISPDTLLKDALAIMKRYRISGIPIVDKDDFLIGIITNRDIRFEKVLSTPVTKLMTPKEHLITAKEGITLDKAKEILHKNRIEKLPIVDDKGKIKGLITVKDIISIKEHPNASRDNRGRLMVGAAVGVGNDAFERVEALVNADVDVIAIDTAHGHTKKVIDNLVELRKMHPDLNIIAGNVATAEGCEALIKAGADAIKVGIGPGSICTTRVVAGIGVPQLSAILSTAGIARKYGIPVIADGGIRYSGDVVKALAAGAESVMIGSIFAGTEEAPGETIIYNGRSFKSYRGMGSLGAMKEGSRDRYFQDEIPIEKLVPEGIEGMVPYRGPLKDVLAQLVGGLKAGMGYCGARDLKELRGKAKFVEVTPAGVKESHPHDVRITREAPNYKFGE